ncbi:hypothetical protein MNB_SM-7-271 [hydrothermal vent metagenome]|uniref:Uncharacterized protein n=1 Tax=hydrothermal vent metagenome TaxID=652676 RepID=A0A1W1BPE8_9ZZZZ
MITPSTLASLIQAVQKSDLKSGATLTKLLEVEVLKSLGDERFLLQIGDKQLTALSKQKLIPTEHYFAKFETDGQKQPTLSHLIKIPKLFKTLQLQRDPTLFLDPKELHKLLSSKEVLQNFKEHLLKELVTSPSKEHFSTYTPLLLSLYHNVLTLPLYFHDTFAFLQLKKRYNKEKKKSFLQFYAFFEHLGAISGIISNEMIKIHVGFEEIKEYLYLLEDQLGYGIDIEVKEMISPLFEPKTNNILDIHT